MKEFEGHLTGAEMDRVLVGDADEAVRVHLLGCAACAAEVEGVRSAVGLLCSALTEMADAERFRQGSGASLLSFKPVRPIRRAPAYLALAASLAVVAALVPFGRIARGPAVKAPAPVVVAQSVESDEALLNEIDQQLSASVPSALAPLEDPAGEQTATKKFNATSNTKD